MFMHPLGKCYLSSQCTSIPNVSLSFANKSHTSLEGFFYYYYFCIALQSTVYKNTENPIPTLKFTVSKGSGYSLPLF